MAVACLKSAALPLLYTGGAAAGFTAFLRKWSSQTPCMRKRRRFSGKVRTPSSYFLVFIQSYTQYFSTFYNTCEGLILFAEQRFDFNFFIQSFNISYSY